MEWLQSWPTEVHFTNKWLLKFSLWQIKIWISTQPRANWSILSFLSVDKRMNFLQPCHFSKSFLTFINGNDFKTLHKNCRRLFWGEQSALMAVREKKKGEKSRVMFLLSENSCQNDLENEIESRLFLLIFIVCHLNVKYARNAIYILNLFICCVCFCGVYIFIFIFFHLPFIFSPF